MKSSLTNLQFILLVFLSHSYAREPSIDSKGWRSANQQPTRKNTEQLVGIANLKKAEYAGSFSIADLISRKASRLVHEPIHNDFSLYSAAKKDLFPVIVPAKNQEKLTATRRWKKETNITTKAIGRKWKQKFNERITDMNEFAPGISDHSGSWRFIVMADVHNAEQYVQIDGYPRTQQQRVSLRAKHIVDYSIIHKRLGGDLVLLPGDMLSGRWGDRNFRKGMGDSNLSLRNAILKYSHWGYNNLRLAFRDAGYNNILVAVGDHEVGDNDWPTGDKSDAFPFHKEGFSNELVHKTVVPMYRSRNGSISVHANTSYAVRHNNTVIITLDEFDQPDKNSARELHGTVAGRISADLLRWLEDVLIVASEAEGVDHIIVQGHLPVLYPVRAQKSSTMVYESADQSPMWQLFRRHGVDLYLCGEVHANSVILDPEGPVQIASRSYRDYSWAMAVDIDSEGIRAECYDARFEPIGTLTIPSVGDVTGTGILMPVDMTKPLLDWTPMSVIASDSVTTFSNDGQFSPHFKSSCKGCLITATKGIVVGDEAGVIFDDVPTAFRNGYETTMELSFKASEHESGILLSILRSGASNLGRGFAIVQFRERLEFFMDGRKASVSYSFTAGTDYLLRVVHQTGGGLQDFLVYVDGVQLTISGEDTKIYVIGAKYSIALGGAGNQNQSFCSAYKYSPFRSEIYSLRIWGRAL